MKELENVMSQLEKETKKKEQVDPNLKEENANDDFEELTEEEQEKQKMY